MATEPAVALQVEILEPAESWRSLGNPGYQRHLSEPCDFLKINGVSTVGVRIPQPFSKNLWSHGAITMAELPALTTIRKVLQHLTTETTRDRTAALAKRGA